MFGLTATGLSAAGRPGGVVQLSPVKFVSVTLQFASAADPVFVTVIVTALLPLVSRRAQSLVTVRPGVWRSEEHTSELQSRENLVCRLLLEKNNVAVSGSCASSVSLHVLLIGTGVDV